MNFRFPLFVTMLHCLGVSASLHVASSWFHFFEHPQKTESLPTLLKKMVPISVMFASATVMRNYAFISLPISTMKMISSSSLALSHVFSCTARLDKFSYKMAAAVSGISAGVCLSAASTMRLMTSAVGAALLFGGLILEVKRGILLKMLHSSSIDSVGPMGLLYMSSTMSPVFCVLGHFAGRDICFTRRSRWIRAVYYVYVEVYSDATRHFIPSFSRRGRRTSNSSQM